MKIFALVHKNECCTGWKRSFFAADYEIDGQMIEPDWAKWCNDDNAPHMISSYELKQSLEEDGEDASIIFGIFTVVDWRDTKPYYCFEHENSAIRYLWSGYCGDWDFQTFTQEEAGEWLQKQTSLKERYADYVTDYVLDEDNDLEDIQGFYEFISTNLPIGSKEKTLAELAIFNYANF